jgi:hypothetical protein
MSIGLPGHTSCMTEPQTITSDHLSRLLDADSGSAIIGLIQGRVDVIEAGQLDSEDFRGALEVISRDELRARLGEDPSDDRLTEQAEALTAIVHQLGG